MTSCEMCGVKTSSLKNINIAGTQMSVCASCSLNGKLVEPEIEKSKTFYKRKKEEDEYDVVSNYISIISKELAKKNLTVHQLARIINIKESSLNKYMTSKIHLDVITARKIESYFKIKLVEKIEGKSESQILDEMKNDDVEIKPKNLAELILEKMKGGNN